MSKRESDVVRVLRLSRELVDCASGRMWAGLAIDASVSRIGLRPNYNLLSTWPGSRLSNIAEWWQKATPRQRLAALDHAIAYAIREGM